MSDGLFQAIRISSTGMHSQRVKMDTVSQNLANAETTRTEEGTPYRRRRAVFEELMDRARGRLGDLARQAGTDLYRTHRGHMGGARQAAAGEPGEVGVEASVGEAADAAEFRVVYDPGHPDADEEGYVMMPNVNVITEMVDMITATRAYEANVSAVQAAKEMFNQALRI